MKKRRRKFTTDRKKALFTKQFILPCSAILRLDKKVYYQQILIKGGADISAYTGPCRVFLEKSIFWSPGISQGNTPFPICSIL